MKLNVRFSRIGQGEVLGLEGGKEKGEDGLNLRGRSINQSMNQLIKSNLYTGSTKIQNPESGIRNPDS